MPSRKYGLNDGPSSSPKSSSLRRLSSLASFNTLNPFNRRRSNNTTESTTTSSTAHLSSPSTTTNDALEHHETSEIVSESGEDEVSELPQPQPQQHAHRRSYICLPDEPASGMARSRTFSNLPLPTRAYRMNRSVPVREQPKITSHQLPSTRLPSPTGSTRRYSSARFVSGPASGEAKQPLFKGRMKRSDTEPLLPVFNAQHTATATGRSTAFKENISPGPARPLPSSLASHAERPVNTARPRNREFTVYYRPPSNGSQALHSDTSGMPSSPLHHHLASAQAAKSYSSPLKQVQGSSVDTASVDQAQAISMQRWSSQPVLTNISHNVQQNRLLSVRQPPTPEPAKQLALSLTANSTQPPRTALAGTATSDPVTEDKENIDPASPSPVATNNHIVVKAMPMPYWCGRFSALNDRYRNEELAEIISKKRTESDNMHSSDATLKRMRRVLEHLRSCCTTNEACDSFVTFQYTLAAIEKMPALARPLGDEKDTRGGRQQSVGTSVSSPASRGNGGRKSRFFDRLLARASKSRKSIG